jgi:hypothetical protein
MRNPCIGPRLADEFIRRFLLRVLPNRFVRIRHYALLAGRNVCTELAGCHCVHSDTGSIRKSGSMETTWTTYSADLA